MAEGNAARIIRAPGRLVVGPTNLTTSYPYGGTPVGLTRLCVLQPRGTSFRVECEGLGEASDILEPPHDWTFSCVLRGFDDDVIASFLAPGYSRGQATRHATFVVPGTATPGRSALARAFVTLYVPDDVANVPSVIIYRGVPVWVEGAELAFQRGEELGLAIALECMRDRDGNTLRVGRLADLSLA
jgi:hypothetical protein